MDADAFDATPTHAVTSAATANHLALPEIRYLLIEPRLVGVPNVQLKGG